MSNQWHTPNIKAMIKKRQQESATTSVNAGTFARPLGVPLPRIPSPPKSGTAESESGYMTWEEYLASLG